MASQADDKPQPEQRGSKDLAQDEVVKPAEALDDDEELAIALASYVPDTEEEKRLLRKIDFTLLPCLWWMYVLAYLDRGNIVIPSRFKLFPSRLANLLRPMPMRLV